jgi:hypothetical protein
LQKHPSSSTVKKCVYLLSGLLTVRQKLWSRAISRLPPLIVRLRRYIGTKLISEINFSLRPAVSMTMRSRSCLFLDTIDCSATRTYRNTEPVAISEIQHRTLRLKAARKTINTNIRENTHKWRLILWASCDAVNFGAKISQKCAECMVYLKDQSERVVRNDGV